MVLSWRQDSLIGLVDSPGYMLSQPQLSRYRDNQNAGDVVRLIDLLVYSTSELLVIIGTYVYVVYI